MEIRSGVLASMSTLITLAALGHVCVPPLAGQTTLRGQVRPRFEIRQPVADGTEAFTSMRTRLSLRSELARHSTVFVELQDVRFWGEESSTLGDFAADAIDMHQAWIEIGFAGVMSTSLRAGRQEVAFGGERLVGAVGWTQQARSFDGLRLGLSSGGIDLSLIGLQLKEARSDVHPADAILLGAYGVLDFGETRSLDAFALYDRDDTQADVDRATLGLRYVASTGPWSYRAEAAMQLGSISDRDVTANMVGLRLGRTFRGGRAGVTLWYDRLSGDDDPADDEVRAFDTLFATNHKFYGFADLFLDVPAHTDQRGLQDAAIKSTLRATGSVRISLDVHTFSVVENAGLSGARLGEEFDLTTTWTYAEGISLTGGLSWLLQADPFAQIGRLDRNLVWAYVMLDAIF
jgi:hypothetical protein